MRGQPATAAVDTIDLYQIHWPDPDPEIEEGWSTMAALKKEGKIRNIGVSNFSVAQMKRAQAIAPITSLQPRYSLLHRDIEAKILPFCAPAQHRRDRLFADGLRTADRRHDAERIASLPRTTGAANDDFAEPQLSRNLQMVNLLRRSAPNMGVRRARSRSPGCCVPRP